MQKHEKNAQDQNKDFDFNITLFEEFLTQSKKNLKKVANQIFITRFVMSKCVTGRNPKILSKKHSKPLLWSWLSKEPLKLLLGACFDRPKATALLFTNLNFL